MVAIPDRLLAVKEVMDLLQVSRSWLYSAAGKAVVGEGLTIGGARRYRPEVIRRIVNGDESPTVESIRRMLEDNTKNPSDDNRS